MTPGGGRGPAVVGRGGGGRAAAAASRTTTATTTRPHLPPRTHGRRPLPAPCALPLDALTDTLTHLLAAGPAAGLDAAGAASASAADAGANAALLPALDRWAVLAYERVVMPCHNMGCGDITYRRYACEWGKGVEAARFRADFVLFYFFLAT
jgi:hypothetical protein